MIKDENSNSLSRRSLLISAADGTLIHFKDWGSGAPVVFSHGWPLQGDAWQDQMFFLDSHGYRVIAHDRRGHGLSSQPWNGNDMDTYADDLATLMDTLDLKGANPGGLPMEVFDGIRKAVLADRSQFFKDLTIPFYGYNRPGATPSQGVRDTFWAQGMQCGLKNAYDCIKQFFETDFTADLKKIDVPTLIVHGSDDQIVPIDAAGKASAKLVKNAKLLIYEGAPHGLPTTHKDKLNARPAGLSEVLTCPPQTGARRFVPDTPTRELTPHCSPDGYLFVYLDSDCHIAQNEVVSTMQRPSHLPLQFGTDHFT